MTPIGYGDSLSHLSHGEWDETGRDWSLTFRWIRMDQAVATIMLTKQMIESLWSVARVRYGLAETGTRFLLPTSSFSIDGLRSIGSCPARELHWSQFREFKLS